MTLRKPATPVDPLDAQVEAVLAARKLARKLDRAAERLDADTRGRLARCTSPKAKRALREAAERLIRRLDILTDALSKEK